MKTTCGGYASRMEDNPLSPSRGERVKNELEEFKKFLGPISVRYTDAQLIQLRSDMHAAARLLLDLYLLKKEAQRKGRKTFDNYEAES